MATEPHPGAARRRFLTSLAALLAATALPACSRRAVSAPDPLDRYLSLSRLLTGFDDLSRTTARAHFVAILAAPGRASALDDLYRQAGYFGSSPPLTLDDLAARGIFADSRLRDLADTLTRWWYTGVYDGPAGPTVATYEGCLARRSYPISHGGCGGPPGFWAEAPAG